MPLIFLVLLLVSFPAQGHFPVVKEVRLANGMKFILVPRGEAPIFSAMIRFRVGGANERKGESGLAHFMEHMAFKGTEKMEGTELTRLIEKEGGQDDNATTSKDMTTYFISFPSDRLPLWAEITSERIFKPVFREFEQERAVVLEERRMRVDNDPDGRLYEELIKKAFSGTSYETPTIGTPEDLKKVSLESLHRFWQEHYHPGNAIGVLVGKFDPAQAVKILQRTFGRIPSKGKTVFEKESPSLSGEIRFRLKESSRPRLLIGYLKPPVPSFEDYVFDLIDQILGDGRTSRLYKRLVVKEKMAANIEVHHGVPGSRMSNLLLISITPLPGHTPEEILNLFDEEVRELQLKGPRPEELEKAVNRLSVDWIWGLRTNEGLASQLSYFEIAAGNWRYIENYPDKIADLTETDIQKVATDYLIPEKRIVGILEP